MRSLTPFWLKLAPYDLYASSVLYETLTVQPHQERHHTFSRVPWRLSWTAPRAHTTLASLLVAPEGPWGPWGTLVALGGPGGPEALFSLSWAAALWGAPPVQFTLVVTP